MLARVSHVMKVTNVLEGRGLSANLVPFPLREVLFVNCVPMVPPTTFQVTIIWCFHFLFHERFILLLLEIFTAVYHIKES